MSQYWKKRVEKANQKKLELTIQKTEKELSKIYAETAEELTKDIAATYVKVQHDLAKDGAIMINDLYRTKRYWSLLDTMNEHLNTLGQKQLTVTENALVELYEYAKKTIEVEIPKQLIKNSFVEPKQIDAKQIVNQVWCIDGKDLSSRIWTDKEATFKNLNKALQDELVRGKSPWEAAQGVASRLGVSESNAYRLARTEAAHAQIEGKVDKYKELGFTHARYLGTNCCDDCQEHDGELFTLDEIVTMIPHHPNCTCDFLLEITND